MFGEQQNINLTSNRVILDIVILFGSFAEPVLQNLKLEPANAM